MFDHSYCLMPLRSTTCDKGTPCCKEPLYKDLLRTDALCHLHTGLPLSTFHLLTQNLLPLYSGSFQLDPIDQRLMTLMKLKLNLLQEYLAEKFSVCQSSVSRILVCWIDLMENHMRSHIPWLHKETVVDTMPQCFKEHYAGTPCIIDCLEISLWALCLLATLFKKKKRNRGAQAIAYSVYRTGRSLWHPKVAMHERLAVHGVFQNTLQKQLVENLNKLLYKKG